MAGEEKRKARKMAQRLIPLGVCQECQAPATNRHHPDHSKPMEVVLLCRKCHMKVEAKVLESEGKRGAAIRWASHSMEAECLNCGKLFTKERQRQTTCSRSCGNLLAWKNRGGAKSHQACLASPMA